MANVICNIAKKKREIYRGDLVSVNGNIGIMCGGCIGRDVEHYYIQGFDGYVIKQYGNDYAEVDKDAEVVLLCNRERLEIDLSKREV